MNFKHEGYHNVNCISKRLGYRNNRGTRRGGYIPEFLLVKGVRLVGGGWARHKRPTQDATKVSPYSPMDRTQGFGSPSTIGILQGGTRSLYNDLWGTHPQLNRGLPNLPRSFTTRKFRGTTNRLGYTMHPRGTSSREHNAPKSNKLLNFNPTNLHGEHNPMQQMQKARTHHVVKFFSPKSNQRN